MGHLQKSNVIIYGSILNISRLSVYILLQKGEFHSFFVVARHLISKVSIDAWLNGSEEEPKGGFSAKDNKNANNERDESYHMQNDKGRIKSAVSHSNKTKDVAKQGAT